MGSLTGSPKVLNEDSADNDLDFNSVFTREDLLSLCKKELAHLPPKFSRHFRFVESSEEDARQDCIRIMQWNILSQALGEESDNFIECPEDALFWSTRRWRLLEEIVTYNPDIVCLQEVDHYTFFKRALGALNYSGIFFPKPDSPCYYYASNNGPDGCAMFYNSNKMDLLKTETRVLEMWGCQSNQVVILCTLRIRSSGKEICVATTHLKARQGPLMASMRSEQGKDLMDFVKTHRGHHPVLIAGDFNAEPTEPVYWTMVKDPELHLDSSYCYLTNRYEEPPYTTWKIREEGEFCHTLDYVFFNPNQLEVSSVLEMPTEEQIGQGRVPSYQYPSDHFSLVCDFRFKELSSVKNTE